MGVGKAAAEIPYQKRNAVAGCDLLALLRDHGDVLIRAGEERRRERIEVFFFGGPGRLREAHVPAAAVMFASVVDANDTAQEFIKIVFVHHDENIQPPAYLKDAL